MNNCRLFLDRTTVDLCEYASLLVGLTSLNDSVSRTPAHHAARQTLVLLVDS